MHVLWIGPGVLTHAGVVLVYPGRGPGSVLSAAVVSALGPAKIAAYIAQGLARELPAGDLVIEVPAEADGLAPHHTRAERAALVRHLMGRTVPATVPDVQVLA